jgi:DNA-binding transcriptional LysR family regulator
MSALAKLDWSLVQAFLAVGETGSLSAAARRLNLTQPTVGRHIQALEQALGVSLFRRQARGMALTEQGEALLGHARAMREAAEALGRDAVGRETDLSGTVRITASVMVAHHMMPDIVAELRAAHPEIQIELVASDVSENLLYREADIAVRMYRPTQLDMVTLPLGHLQLGLFGSKSYIERHGMPGPDTLDEHDIIGLDRGDAIIRGFREFGTEVRREDFPIRCDNNAVTWELTRAGCGLGFGVAALAEMDPELVEIETGLPLPRLEVWLTAHEAVRRSPRVDAVWKLLALRLGAFCRKD